MATGAQPFLQGVVAATFVLAGLAKVISRSTVAPLLEAVGVPPRLAPFVPVAELAIGVALFAGVVLSVPAAAVLSLLFLWVHARNRRRVACNCFGRLDRLVPRSLPVFHAMALAICCLALLVFTLGEPASDPDALASGGAVSVSLTLGSLLLATTWEFRRRRAAMPAPGGGA